MCKKNWIISCVFSALFLVSCGRYSVNRDSESPLLASDCGTEIGSFNGIPAYSNGVYTGTGNSCRGETGGSWGYRYQCKELFARYFGEKYGIPYMTCHAKDCIANAANNSHYRVFYNNQLNSIQPGDAIAFGGGSYGHIAIITKVTANAVTFLQQNTSSAYGSVSRSGNSLGNWGSLYTQGIIRAAKASAEVSIEPIQPDNPPKELTETPLSGCQITVTASWDGTNDPTANVRSSPSLSADKIAKVNEGATLTLISEVSDGENVTKYGKESSTWYKVKANGKVGYLWSPYGQKSCN